MAPTLLIDLFLKEIFFISNLCTFLGHPVYDFIIYLCIIAQLWLTSHPRSTVVLLETGTPGTSREIL